MKNRHLLSLAISIFCDTTNFADEPSIVAANVAATPFVKQASNEADVDPNHSFKADWAKDFKIRLGMTVGELKKYINENNAKVNAARPPAWETDHFHPPAYAYKELHLHVFLRMKRSDNERQRKASDALTYWVNGRTQFWIDLAIEDGKVAIIYISYGNWSQMLPAFRFARKGERRSEFFGRPKIEPSRRDLHTMEMLDGAEP